MLTSLRLQKFRSYDDFAVELSEAVNIIVGPNASGKTNLLEAVQVVATGTSFRGSDIELLQHGAQWSRLDAVNQKSDTRTVKLEHVEGKIQKSYELLEQKQKRLKFNDKLPLVIFEPDDLRLLSSQPERRRNFLDKILSQLTPEYSRLINNYKRTLLQRNKLLKQLHYSGSDQIFAWDIRLSDLGAMIAKTRSGLINKLSQEISSVYSSCAGKTNQLQLIYQPSVELQNYSTNLLAKLETNRQIDIQKGYTSCGPHREDFEIFLNSQPAKITASRGEIRTIVLSLKLLELSQVELVRGTKPLLLLDDVFSELDGLRRQSLTATINTHQTLITTTDADIVKKHYSEQANIILTSN